MECAIIVYFILYNMCVNVVRDEFMQKISNYIQEIFILLLTLNHSLSPLWG